MRIPRAALGLFFFGSAVAYSSESTCFGTVGNGQLEGGVELPMAGANFQTYSSLGSMLGRTYVHSIVRDVVVAAYAALEKSAPEKRFVYGETGWKAGGRFRPHRTHQNGLSVDFMVPVVDRNEKSALLPASVWNRYGYDIEFDVHGVYADLSIDFAAVAEHLYALDRAARARDIEIALVIFDLPFLPELFATTRGPYLQEHIKFMKGRPWVRHDEHYHVDFAVPCKSRAV